jgi:uncharacterized RmlC-like cupin family protein
MATITHMKDLMGNTTFEPPCNIFYGICRDTVKNANMVMGYTTSGPDMRNQRHYHINCEVGQYRIKGHDRILIGPDHDQQILDVAPGDFVYIPKGEIHGAVGQGEMCELIFCYAGVNSKEDSGTVFVEPAWEKRPHPQSSARESSGGQAKTETPKGKGKTMARVIRTPREDMVYAEPLVTGVGIDNKTVPKVRMVMGTSIMPPGERNRRHYHVNADLGMFKIKGHDRLLIGPDHEMQEMDFKDGDFVYIPKGEIHGAINLDHQRGLLVLCYVGVGSVEETQKIYVEPPMK